MTAYRWAQQFTPLLIDAARPVRHLTGDRWFVDETYVKVSGVWSYLYLYQAVDQHGQVIDVHVTPRSPKATAPTMTRTFAWSGYKVMAVSGPTYSMIAALL